jgi:NAD(P)-dependent dehydrogenase (short-subunit alcohol dehydrogenase family)
MTGLALITGVSGGIGSATARALLTESWSVIGLDVRPPPPDLSDRITYAECDLSDAEAISHAVATTIGDQALNALINNAAIQVNKPLAETTNDEWELVMNTNVRSAFVCMRETHAALVHAKGAIVNVASVHAIATSANVGAYAASKGAMVALTRAAAVELADKKVRCNAVLPGAVDTPMLRDGLGRRPHPRGAEGNLQALIERTPLQAVASPDDIAATILFLASSTQASFITGQALVVDGGATARLSTE